jgi:hypothetical protein
LQTQGERWVDLPGQCINPLIREFLCAPQYTPPHKSYS